MNARTLAWGLVLLGFAMMLCGCQTVEPTTVYVDRVVEVRPTVAPSLLRCTAEPAPPGPGARQRDLPPYLLDLVSAGRDCRRKLGTVADIVRSKP
ncbi:hypothetical protein [Methylobacterium sp. Leaf112]|uniref:hypothetical protein n=1 Tax=Methylobacterium sp. Leaf112 TaxID=1736258 RepID=UPI0006F1EB18|nr:hypothetical protein [Methylobacterium sp. Leaf112]KQP62161.1 hypothetical protein ASF52_05750 [Methylobacterium sp. Leaf112]